MTEDQLQERLRHPLTGVDLTGLGPRQRGKVRDAYALDGGKRLLVTTDRISAFDRVLGTIPFRGQVLNQLSNWWFARTQDLVKNHLLRELHPNVVLVRDAEPLPVEVVVRAYLTGSSKTALWTLYQQGKEEVYGLKLAPGLKKNTPLEKPIITPTTKGEKDTPISSEEIVSSGLLPAELWDRVQRVALELFRRGQEVAAKAGLILVDTKYEFGLIEGELTLIDEVHTPDSSRYWVAGTENDEFPLHQDKEVLRLWLVGTGFQGDGEAPELTDEKALEMARHYLKTYEMLTGEILQPPEMGIEQAVKGALVC